MTPETVAAAAIAALVVLLAIAAKPVFAVWLLVPGTLLLTGVERGVVVPLFRPNEVLLLFLIGGVAFHGLVRLTLGWRPIVCLSRLDVVVGAFALAASVLPLAWMFIRDRPLSQDDLLYALAPVKYVAIYALVRVAVRRERHVAIVLTLSMAASCLIAVIGVVEALGLLGVPELLARYYTPDFEFPELYANRGSSTLGSGHALGDVMTFNLAIALGFLARGTRHAALLTGASALFVFGTVASGQFSSVLALAIGVLAVAWITDRTNRVLAAAVPAGIVAGAALQPVIQSRISDFSAGQGLPQSWLARLTNLRTHFWPELFRDFNWVLGVRPSSRVPSSDPTLQFIWIESGHTWLLWVGGVPLAVAYAAFTWIALRTTRTIARSVAGPIGVAAIAGFAAVAVQAVLMFLDAHITLRGAADLLFVLLALAQVARVPVSPNGSTGEARTSASSSTGPSRGPVESLEVGASAAPFPSTAGIRAPWVRGR